MAVSWLLAIFDWPIYTIKTPVRRHVVSEGGAQAMLQVPRHATAVSPIMSRKLELAYQREALRIGRYD